MKIRILAVGAERSGLFEPGVAEYLERIKRVVPAEVEELPASRKGGREVGRAKAEEGQALLGRLRPGELVVAMDERGEAMDSQAFAQKVLQAAMNQGRDLVFLIGGAEGHGEAVRARADRILALSKMTLPHRLARLVLVEQIYRGLSILRGEPYHK